jgi:hypothetical protein
MTVCIDLAYDAAFVIAVVWSIPLVSTATLCIHYHYLHLLLSPAFHVLPSWLSFPLIILSNPDVSMLTQNSASHCINIAPGLTTAGTRSTSDD